MDRLTMLAEKFNINMMLDTLEFLIKASGGMRDIMQAIDTNDLTATVRAATKALNKIGIPETFEGLVYLKSAEQSNRLRKEGNLYYLDKKYKQAILSYNKALAYAPNNSIEVKLAHGNLSAVLLAIKAFKDCKLNIEAAQESDCPEFLRVKLEKRLIEANKNINQEMMHDTMITSMEYILNYLEFDVPRNAEIPCVSADVHVDDNKNIMAANDIKSGTMVAFERAYVSFQDELNEYGACYNCHKMGFFFVPCEGCCKALFCSKECREKCLEEYHRIECHIVSHMNVESTDVNQHLNKLATRVAIKMSKKLSWKELSVASLEMGATLLKNSLIAEAFDCNNPISMLCYDDQTEVPREVMMNRSLVCAMTVHWLSSVPDYLPTDLEEKEKAIDSLSRIILHLNTTFMRQISIPCSVIDYETNPSNTRFASEVQRNVGWFSFASKLEHSCEPNLLVLGFNDQVALITLQHIRKGEPLTISYIEHFYDMNLLPCPKNSRIRQKLIFKFMEYTCDCRVCLLEWHSRSHSEVTLTDRQQEVFNQYRVAMNSPCIKNQMKGICTALDELTGCINTSQHRSLYVDLLNILSICQCVKVLNKSYAPEPSLHPFHHFINYL